jgi:hypothetical protein
MNHEHHEMQQSTITKSRLEKAAFSFNVATLVEPTAASRTRLWLA